MQKKTVNCISDRLRSASLHWETNNPSSLHGTAKYAFNHILCTPVPTMRWCVWVQCHSLWDGPCVALEGLCLPSNRPWIGQNIATGLQELIDSSIGGQQMWLNVPYTNDLHKTHVHLSKPSSCKPFLIIPRDDAWTAQYIKSLSSLVDQGLMAHLTQHTSKACPSIQSLAALFKTARMSASICCLSYSSLSSELGQANQIHLPFQYITISPE